jgi:hypothetical protein
MKRGIGQYIFPIVSSIVFSLVLSLSLYSFQNAKEVTVVPADSQLSFLSGKVIDTKTGAAISGVEVSTSSAVATTNANGIFMLPLSAGSYTVSFYKSEYTRVMKTVSVEANKESSVVVALTQ